jgi:hypothetical protein
MSIHTLSRCGITLFLVALVSGCSLFGGDGSSDGIGSSNGSSSAPSGGGDCGWNRRGCIYEGAYEPGERGYAELEAKRLNQAQLERLRRSGR